MMPVAPENEMTFWDHLDELRKLLFGIAIALAVATVGLFAFMRDFFDLVILGPTRNDFFVYQWIAELSKKSGLVPEFCLGYFQVKLININLSSQFFFHISTAFWLALVLCIPIVAYQAFRFVKPALYSTERKNTAFAFLFGTVLFYVGLLVNYTLAFPLTLRFLAGYELSSHIENSVSLDSYMSSFLMMSFVMGLVFELPLLSWLLSKMGLLRRRFFSTYRKHAVVVLLVLAAFITPTSDPFTLMVVFLPIYLLWEVSAWVVKK